MIEWLTFFMIMAVGQFSPGPDMVLLTRVSLSEGKRAGWAAACGIACGLMIHAGIAVSGLAFIFARNENIYRWVKYLACAYLLWLAYQLLNSAAQQMKFKLEKSVSKTSNMSLLGYWKIGFLCNILNPKVAVFLAGVVLPFLGMYADVGMEKTSWAVLLWATIFLEGWILWSLWVYVLQARMIKHFYQRSAYVIDGIFGVCLLVLAVMVLIN